MKKIHRATAMATGLAALIPTIAMASTGAAASMPSGPESLLSSLPMLAAFGFLFYFLLIRPQSQRAKKQQEMIANLAKGDEVVTTGGFLGKIDELPEGDDFITLTIAKGIQVKVKKSHIVNALPKGTLTV